MKKISVVIPAYFEEAVIEECYKRVERSLSEISDYEYEIIFIDDGSKDKTYEILERISNEDKNVKVISFSRNFGHQCAVTCGLKYITGDVGVIIDADLQDPPELIKEMLKLWEDGNDVVYAKRKKRKGESAFKLFTAGAFYRMLNRLSDIEIPRDTGDFRLADKKVIEVINSLPEHNKFLRGLFSWVGFKQVPFEYERNERFAGKTKYPLKKMMKLATDGIMSFSTKPLRIIGGIGLFSILVSIAILVYAVLSFAFEWNSLTAGWTSIMITITFLTGIQLLSIWIMSEYIGKIFEETKNRPQYIIRKTINID